MMIQDGTGDSKFAKVDSNKQLHTFSVIETEKNAAVEDGYAFNVNTGIIALTGSSDSAILYIKNDESPLNGDSDLVIDTIVIGINTRSATVTEDPILTVIRNPTAGTIVSNATDADIISNSNFGSNNTLSDSDVYKGADGYTLTDGTDHAIVQCSEVRNTIPELNIDLPKGSSIGLKLDLNTSGGANVYAAIVCHRKDGKNARS